MNTSTRFSGTGVVVIAAILLNSVAAREVEPRGEALVRDGIKAELWVQTSAEYMACCEQTYRLAGNEIQREVTKIHSSRSARCVKRTDLPLAVIMDLDETVLDNSTYQTYLCDTNRRHSDKLYSQFVTDHRSSIRLVPGSKQFIDRVEALGVTVIYITNRAAELREVTTATLAQWGINTRGLKDPKSVRMLLRDGESDKTARRHRVFAGYNVIALIGDQLVDFMEVTAAANEEQVSARRDAVNKYLPLWGTRWFILPNPVYGDWLNALPREADGNLRRVAGG